MKYYYYTFYFRDGEHEYSDCAVIGCHESDDVEKAIGKCMLSQMFGDDTTEENGKFWSSDYCRACWLGSIREISKSHFMVLKQYLMHDTFEPEPEKVDFT